MATPLPGHEENLVAEATTYALAFHQRGMLAEAEKFYAAILNVRPDHFDALRLLGILRQQQGDNAEAMRLISAALRLNPQSFDALSSFAGILYTYERYDEALAAYDQALAINPDHPETLYNRGNALLHLDRNEEALAAYDQALARQPSHPEMLVNRGSALVALRRAEEALEAFDKVLAIEPGHAIAFGNRRTPLKLLGRYEEVLESCRKELDLAPDDVAVLNDCGNALFILGRPEEALATYEKSLAIAPDQPGVLKDRANLLRVLRRHGQAVDAYDGLLAADPNDAELLYNRGISLWALSKRQAAIESLERALTLGHPRALGDLAMCRMRLADWARAGELLSLLSAHIVDGKVVDPFVPLAFGFHPIEQLKSAEQYVRTRIPDAPKPFVHSAATRIDKLRIAYLSSDFRQHPVGTAVPEMIERHDRARFEIIGVSFGTNDASSTRARLIKAFDQFHDVFSHSDRHTAGLLNDLQVHIAVALNGLTNGSRPGILAYRPTPIQVSYLGYAGTMGAEFIDYILADETVLPFDQQPFFAERIVQLPDCYHANDATRRISQPPARSELGLPDQGLVFCCFNQNYKIAQPVFEIWMRLLAQVPGSVLWLSEMNEDAYANLRSFAAARGVDPGRLVFATWAGAMEDHLARQRAADLFLDTLPYNAHSTTCDALWAGVPVVTCAGTAFPGRVAASMLKAAGLPELVTHSLDDYEALALKLATDPALLSSIRRKLTDNRTTCALFDGDRFRRHIEAAYETMWDIHRRGESPRSFRVAPSA